MGLLIFPLFFAAPVLGMIGIINDRRKFLAITSVAIVIGVLLYILVCQWLSTYYGNMLQ